MYIELKPLNAYFKQKIQHSTESTLKELIKELKQKAFLDYRIEKDKLDSLDQEKLSFQEKKKILIEVLDSNMDYIPLEDIQDRSFNIDTNTIELNKSFYDGESI